MTKIKSLLVIWIALMATISHGQTITGLNGPLNNGEVVIISGSSFGTKPANAKGTSGETWVFDDFESGIHNGYIGSPWTVIYDTDSDDAIDGEPKYWDTGPMRGGSTMAARSYYELVNPNSTFGIADWTNTVNKAYTDFWVYIDAGVVGDPCPAGNEACQDGGCGGYDPANLKLVRHCNDTNMGNTANWYLSGLCYSSYMKLGVDDLSEQWLYPMKKTDVYNKWTHIQYYYDRGSLKTTGLPGNGTFKLWIDGTLKLNKSDWDGWEGPGTDGYNDVYHVMFGQYCSLRQETSPACPCPLGESPTMIYWDDCYVDLSQARVEIGNNPVYGDCTVREIQPINTWADGQISITVNTGAFETGTPVYVFVVKDDGSESDGFSYVIGTSGDSIEVTPIISYVTGDVDDQGTITITGSGFGLKDPVAPQIWETWEDGVDLAFLSELYPDIWQPHTGDKGARYYSDYSYRGDLSVGRKVSEDQGESGTAYTTFDLSTRNNGTKSYAIWKARLHNFQNGGVMKFQHKSIRLKSSPNVYTGTGPYLSGFWMNYSNPSLNVECVTSDVPLDGQTSLPQIQSEGLRPPYNQWYTSEFLFKRSSTYGIADGFVGAYYYSTGGSDLRRLEMENVVNLLDNGGTAYVSDSVLLPVMIFNVDWTINPDLVSQVAVYCDDLYVDNTWSRVLMGDNPVYEECTNLEPQIPTAWADGSITVTVNTGIFQNNVPAYLFVVNEDGIVSAGEPVTIGIGYADVIPPTASPIYGSEYLVCYNRFTKNLSISVDETCDLYYRFNYGCTFPIDGDFELYSSRLYQGENIIPIELTSVLNDSFSCEFYLVDMSGNQSDTYQSTITYGVDSNCSN